jgi:hypothetical protein
MDKIQSCNQEIIRARALIAELKTNNKKALELRHTLSNLLTIHRLMLEEIHRTARPTLQARLIPRALSGNCVPGFRTLNSPQTPTAHRA